MIDNRSGWRRLERVKGELTRARISAALLAEGRVDLDGMTLVFGGAEERGSRFVDLAYLRRNGQLVQ